MQIISVNNEYASGGKRLIAFFIDRLVISIVFSMFFWRWWWGPFDFHDSFWGLHFHFSRYNILSEAFSILYFAAMESSQYQATLGKIAMGIKVVDKNNLRVSFATAFLRNLSKILSALIFCVGYLMIIFDERKQGLHDKIADTFVVKS